MRAKQGRKKLSDRYFRRVDTTWKGRKAQEVVPRAKISSRRRRKCPSSWRISPRLFSEEIRIRFFFSRPAWFNLQTKSSWRSRDETNAHWINAGYSNFGIHLLFLASSPGDSSSLRFIIRSFVFVRTLASCYSPLRSNGVALFASRIFSVMRSSSL